MSAGAVLLVNPRVASPRGLRLPLSLLSLAAVLEGRRPYAIVDGNVDPRASRTALGILSRERVDLVAVSVMPGPQVAPAIAITRAIRDAHPGIPVVWGGYFPTLYPDAAMAAPYVDYLVRGQGEDTLLELLDRLPDAGPPAFPASARDTSGLRAIAGLSFRDGSGVVHNDNRQFRSPDDYPEHPVERVGDVGRYLRPSFMGRRTTAHQAATGCRFVCSFCGVVSFYGGVTKLPAPARAIAALTHQRERHGADSVQFYDNNFFDKEPSSVAMLEALARLQMPWWCFARADTMMKLSAKSWRLMQQSQLRMAYIGAEAADDEANARMRKGGTKVHHIVEVAERCRAHGIIPELSFILGGPDDPESDVERTLAFVRTLKERCPESEIIFYYYSPTPQRDPRSVKRDAALPLLPVLSTYGAGGPTMPTTPEEWAEPRWVSWVSHLDAPWITPKVRRRVADFSRVLACRFPTVQDYHTPAWGKRMLASLARWRYSTRSYALPVELRVAQSLVRLRVPQAESI